MREAVVRGERIRSRPVASRVAVYVWLALAAVSLLIVATIFAAPLALARGSVQTASSIYYVFSFVCHQIPERSFHLAGHKFAVCSRCTGIYAGFALAVLFYPLARPLDETETASRIWLVLAALPLGIDFALGYFNIWANTHASRFITGALLSSVAAFYIVPGLVDISSTIIRRRKL